jgi:hypothetical protein
MTAGGVGRELGVPAKSGRSPQSATGRLARPPSGCRRCSIGCPATAPRPGSCWWRTPARRNRTIDRLSAEVDRILKKPEVAERFAKLGGTPVGGKPRHLGDLIDAEMCK